MGLHAFLDGPSREARSIPFRSQHLDHLSPTRNQRRHGLRLLIMDRSHRWANSLSTMGEHLRIQAIDLGRLPGGPHTIPDLPRIDDHDGQPDGREGASQRYFEPTCRFQSDQGELQRLDRLHERSDPLIIRHKLKRGPRMHRRYRRCCVRPPCQQNTFRSWGTSVSPVLARYGLEALSTVQVDDRRNGTIRADPRPSRLETQIFAICPTPVVP